jgi:hypothetical protein
MCRVKPEDGHSPNDQPLGIMGRIYKIENANQSGHFTFQNGSPFAEDKVPSKYTRNFIPVLYII